MAATSSSLNLHASTFIDEFVDVAELNAGASRAILARIDEVRSAARDHRRTVTHALTILGPAGGGKTHLVARVRRAAGAQATLVLVRPYFGATLSLRDVLATAIDQLCRRPKGATVSQLDLVSAYWLAPNEGEHFPTAMALETRAMEPAARAAQLERAVHALVDRLPELAPVAHLARALIGAPGLEGAERWAELAWLSGREPRASGSAAPGTAVLGDGDVLSVLSILSTLAAPIAPIVVVFDQLENLATEGTERVLGYGNVVSELVDSVPCLTLVQLALTSEWLQFIEPQLSLSQRSRVSGYKTVLDLPSETERKLLLRAWQDRLSPPPEPSARKRRLGHPLSREEVDYLLRAPGMTPRLLATAYARAMAGKEAVSTAEPPAEPVDARSVVRAQWEIERSRAASELEEMGKANVPVDAAEIAEGLGAALAFVPRLEARTHSERERHLTTVRAPGSELVIVHLTAMHHKSVAAGLARAAELARSSKVAVLRERRFEIPASWTTVEERRVDFERLPNARWLWLDADEVAQCLALARTSSLARSKRLRAPGSDEPITLEVVRREIEASLAPAQWTSASSIARWLDDVPRETRPASSGEGATTSTDAVTGAVPEKKSAAAPLAPSNPATAAPAPSSPTPEPLHAVRSWLRAGRAIGKETVSHYVGRLARRLGRRGPS
jgi:hypothetical protein